mmetsp:Transcript_24140/g.77868  ORF Transcript_24140/g.77868 Transcript_24140/m.77868 type:complete len:314 (+) Transcript_24140:168-1109(+)
MAYRRIYYRTIPKAQTKNNKKHTTIDQGDYGFIYALGTWRFRFISIQVRDASAGMSRISCDTQTGVNRLYISDEGVSSRDPDDPYKAIVSVTNANDYPICIDHHTTALVGEFVKVENRANVANTGHAYQTTLTSPNSAEEAQLPDEVHTAAHSASHAEMEQQIHNDYQRIKRIPITYQGVCILYSGLGGCTKGIELRNQEHGTSSRIVCVVDADKRMLEIHARNFPSIPTCLCKIGYSYTTTVNKIALVYPRHRWSEGIILASVECKLGSTANIHQRNIAQFAKQNLLLNKFYLARSHLQPKHLFCSRWIFMT